MGLLDSKLLEPHHKALRETVKYTWHTSSLLSVRDSTIDLGYKGRKTSFGDYSNLNTQKYTKFKKDNHKKFLSDQYIIPHYKA